ncbi:MAG: hypothetical protein IT374_12010 [Polyangiaceae bacterium]|nr:hypothetical protein [Polyangiaceae bacterium]
MTLRRALPALLLSVAPLAACGGATVDDLPAAGAGGVGGSGSGTAGSGTAGSGTAGSGTAGTGTAGSAGSGKAGASGSPSPCTSDFQCPVGPCATCPDGSKACPVAKCASGVCTTSQPTCQVGPQCKTAADCPQPGGACQPCPDGSFSCPSVECVGGACVFSSGEGCKPAPCAAQDAAGGGTCFGSLGFAWSGATCEKVTGCDCVGADCGSLYKTHEHCMKVHASCVSQPPCAGKLCGDTCSNCVPGGPCPPVVEYCGPTGECGPAFPVCTAQKNPCFGASCGTPCVVDCDAPGCAPTKGMCNGAGLCSPGSPVCDVANCDAMKADGDGLCDAFFGFAWDGARCVGIGGCSCVGPDCNKLYPSLQQCLDAESACACQGKGCGAPCTCPGGDCAKTFYSCTSDTHGSCQPGTFACPF